MPSLAIKIPSIRKANKSDLAVFFEVSLPTIDAWTKKDCPSVQRGARGTPWVFDLREVAEWVYGNKPGTTEDGEIDPERMEPKERKDWYEGERVRRVLAEAAQELMTAEQYISAQSDLLKEIAISLETMPDLLERKCNLAPAVLVEIRNALDSHRTAVAERVVSDDSID